MKLPQESGPSLLLVVRAGSVLSACVECVCRQWETAGGGCVQSYPFWDDDEHPQGPRLAAIDSGFSGE
jgi:hypothetical protein